MTRNSDIMEGDEASSRALQLIDQGLDRIDRKVSTKELLRPRQYLVHRSVDEIRRNYLGLSTLRFADKTLNVEDISSNPVETRLEFTMQRYDRTVAHVDKIHVTLAAHENGTQIDVIVLRPRLIPRRWVILMGLASYAGTTLLLMGLSAKAFESTVTSAIFYTACSGLQGLWARRGWKKNVLRILDRIEKEIRPYEIDQQALSPMRRPALAAGGYSDSKNKQRW